MAGQREHADVRMAYLLLHFPSQKCMYQGKLIDYDVLLAFDSDNYRSKRLPRWFINDTDVEPASGLETDGSCVAWYPPVLVICNGLTGTGGDS